ncbi:hypothetical protein B0A49_11486 [Cryomyces minteri]|uniref:CREG-like beta-barrel domain-containing protein n=1 Tax=Cryomyces minteri TaxID=331657 RepID=A0A4U0W1T3_9PEZI|nr:hypothetical protein B0A49_11486 [Cryomyces minteri]
MHLSITLPLFLVPFAASFSFPPPQHIFSNPPSSSDFKIPTIHESAIQARRILNLETIGTLSTVFPHSSSVEPAENRPSGLEGAPIGLMDYYANCEPQTGNPTILAISIATSFKNVAAGSNITLSLRWHPPDAHLRRYSAANLPRFSLVGHLEELTQLEIEKEGINGCFVKMLGPGCLGTEYMRVVG